MKKQFLLLTACIAFVSTSFSQTPTYRTTEFVGNIPANNEFAIDMCKDANGNMYAVGQLNNGASLDISVTKFDILGNLLWEKTYDNGGDDIPLNIEIGESDNIYVTGNSEDGGTPKGLIVKYNENGIIQWQAHPGGISGTTVLGSTTRALNGDTYLIGSFMGSATDRKAIIYKYLSDGTSDWTEVYDYSSSIDNDDDEFSAISINPYNGDVYVGGMANGTKILLVKYNSSGTEQWTKIPRNGKVLDLTSGGSSFSYNIYIAAQTSVSFPDAYTAKYNSSGNMQWEDTYTDGSLNGPAEIHYYSSNIYVAYQHQAGSSNPDTKDFIKKYNTSGTEQWTIDNMYLGTDSPGEFAVSDNAELLSFDGSYMYCIESNLEIWKYNLTDPFIDFDVFYNNINSQYTSLANDPEIVLPVKSLVNNGIVFLLGDGQMSASNNSRISLSSFCFPVSTVSIDAPLHSCDNPLSISALNASSAKWDYRAENGGTFTSFSDINALNTDVTVSYTNEMDIMLMVRGEDENTCPTYTNKVVNFHSNPTPVISGDLSFCEGSSTVLDPGDYGAYNWSNGEDSQTITVNTSGVFSVEVVDATTYCVGTSPEVTVTQLDLATVSLGTDKEICEGESITLDAGTFDSYLWSTGESSQSIDVSTSVQIILEITSAGYCGNSDTIMVAVNDLPIVDLGIDQTNCIGETVTLDAGAFSSYAWSTGASSQTIDVTTTGDYILEVIGANTCSNSDTVYVEFSECTGINNISSAGLQIYPNPAKENITIDNGEIIIKSIIISDITGKSVLNIESNQTKQTLNISELKQGVYFVKINTSNNSKTIRLIKK